MTFLSHPTCSSGLIYDFVDHYTLLNGKRQFLLTCKVSRHCTMLLFKFKRQYLLTCKVRRLHGSRPIIGSNVGSIVYTSGDSPFIARRVDSLPLCPD